MARGGASLGGGDFEGGRIRTVVHRLTLSRSREKRADVSFKSKKITAVNFNWLSCPNLRFRLIRHSMSSNQIGIYSMTLSLLFIGIHFFSCDSFFFLRHAYLTLFWYGEVDDIVCLYLHNVHTGSKDAGAYAVGAKSRNLSIAWIFQLQKYFEALSDSYHWRTKSPIVWSFDCMKEFDRPKYL